MTIFKKKQLLIKHSIFYRTCKLFVTGCFIQSLLYNISFAQPVQFFHINSSLGLSGNNVTSAVTDKNGLLWIGTTTGLNLYDGYKVSPFDDRSEQGLAHQHITALFCDSHNRIWAGAFGGLYLIDSNRQVSKLQIEKQPDPAIISILEKTNHEIVILTLTGFYLLKNNHPSENGPLWDVSKLLNNVDGIAGRAGSIRDVCRIADNSYLFVVGDTLSVIDFERQTITLNMVLPDASAGCRLDDASVLVATHIGQLYKIDLATNKIVKEFGLSPHKNEWPVITDTRKLKFVNPELILITSYFGGLFFFNPQKETVIQYRHDPLNEKSISENKTNDIFFDNNGNFFISTFNTGLNYCNLNNYRSDHIATFTDNKGVLFDGYVNDMVEDKDKNLWIAAYDKIVYWNRQSGAVRFLPYYKHFTGTRSIGLEIKAICIDSTSKIWASIYGQGVAIIDPVSGSYRVIGNFGVINTNTSLRSAYIHDLYADTDGKIWACNNTGVFNINSKTHAIDTLLHHPVLNQLTGKRINKIWGDSRNRLWFSSELSGAYCYNRQLNTLVNYSTENGLPSDHCYCFSEDKKGTIYIATTAGLAALSGNGMIKVFGSKDGLREGECSGLQADNEGNIWLINKGSLLVCYSPSGNTFKYFSAAEGLGNTGFKVNSFFRSSSGELYWGNNRGLSFFDPQQLLHATASLPLSVQKLILNDTSYLFSSTSSTTLEYNQNDVSFYFTAADPGGSKNIYYQYLLQGFDHDWVKGIDITQAKYNSLPPGKYIFKVKASNDGIVWTNSSNEIYLLIKAPFWKTKLFYLALLTAAATIFYFVYRWFSRRRKDKEQLRLKYEKKIAAVEMNVLRAQMNPHFIFNSLNSINDFILSNDPDNASGYLTKFSRLIRLILDNSRTEWVLLENELKALELYIEMETLRFEYVFTSTISVAETVSTSSVLVPPLIIQPYVENAIWHGLLNRQESGGKLCINIWREKEELKIQIEDNGIGRAASGELKNESTLLHKSHGMKITAERLGIVNNVYNVNAGVTVTDLTDQAGHATGTRILVTMKYKTHESADN